jgi:hypothetical protein
MAKTALSPNLDFTTGVYLGDKNDTSKILEIYGIISGIEFAGKRSVFIKDYADSMGITTNGWKRVLVNGDNYIKVCDSHLKEFIGFTAEEFQQNDDGIMVSTNRKDLWFADELMDEWTALQEKYTEYKNRIWEILQNTNALNMCSNRVSGIYLGEISINQQMECMQTIGDKSSGDDSKNVTETPKNDTKDTKTATKTEIEVPNVTPKNTSNEKIPEVIQTDASPEKNNIKNSLVIIIILSVIGLCLLGGIVYFVQKRKKKSKPDKKKDE